VNNNPHNEVHHVVKHHTRHQNWKNFLSGQGYITLKDNGKCMQNVSENSSMEKTSSETKV
jgi:hypothetical protein